MVICKSLSDANYLINKNRIQLYNPSMRPFPHFLVLLLLALPCNFTQQQTYAYPYVYTSFGFPSNEYFSLYDLGQLSVGYSITITLTAPNTASSVGLDDIVEDAFLFFQTPLVPDTILPAFTYIDNSPTLFFFPPVIGKKPFYSVTYNVTFPTDQITSAHFKLLLGDYDGSVFNYLIYTYLSVEVTLFKRSNVQSLSVGTPVQTILRATESVRAGTFKVIYVDKDNSLFNFSISPQVIPSINCNPQIYLYSLTTPPGTFGNEIPMVPLNNFDPLISIEETNAGAGTPVYINNVAHYSYLFSKKGYYLFELFFKEQAFQVDETVFYTKMTFNTDTYACPYNPAFPDVYLNFQGCTRPISQNGLPCLDYDSVLQTCLRCIQSYTLVNGTCWASTTCPPRQYFRYGSCYNVSLSCGSFDPFTGECYNCSDPNNFRLENGSCIGFNVNCGSRQWKSNNICFNVSSTCDGFDRSTGNCISCISNLYQLNQNGTCTLIVVNCPQGQYAAGLSCITIPRECTVYDTTLSACTVCIRGYLIKNGVCERILCPQGQVPSLTGVNCTDVSPLCADYDPISGNCLTCKNAGYTVREGQCLQIHSPLAGCKQREKLGFGPCSNAQANCKIMDLSTGNCNECNYGFYLDYTGHCRESIKCGLNHWSVNGQCMKMPQNCLQTDNLGMCLKCNSKEYRILLGQCVYFKPCQERQYLNSAGQCVDVSPTCATWNPSNGQCITCNSGLNLSGGICCREEEIIIGGQCVNLSVSQVANNTSGSSCLVPHPSLNICLQCREGYAPDYTIPYSCLPL